MKMPSWLENAVFYEIYPQSFKDSNSDGIGDIKGMIQKLDHIRDLGCNAIWINPLFDSPFMDAGYDISNYYQVAPRYGTNDDLCEFFEEAHKRNIKVILDLVPGHTSLEHEWFKQSGKMEKNEYTDRYVWTNSCWEMPKGLNFINGMSERDGCCVTNYYSCQPALNYGFANPTESWQQSTEDEGPKATFEELKNIMRFWLGMGCDGFRVDMANSLVKNDEDSKATIGKWQEIRQFIDTEFPNSALVAEWGDPAKSIAGGFHMCFLLHFGDTYYNDMFHCDEPFFSADKRGSAKKFIETYKRNMLETNGEGLMCIPSGNHDMPRMAKYLDETQIKLAFSFIFSMPGAPFVYYGDEIGMRYLEGITSVEGGYGRTGSRSPMQWSDNTNAGFSCAPKSELYIPIDESDDRPTVQKQMTDDNSIMNEVRRLIKLRLDHKALQSSAKLEFVTDDYPLIIKRTCDDEEITIIINPSSEPVRVDDIDGEILYSVCKNATLKNGGCELDGCSTAFVKTK